MSPSVFQNLETATASVDAKTPALGQALAAGSTPVVLTAAQQSALTPPAAITGYSTEASLAALLSATVPITANGTISTQNLVPAGTATTLSAVELTVAGRDTMLIQTVGTYTGVLSMQGTVNGTTWMTLSGGARLLNHNTSTYSATIPTSTQSIFETSISGLLKVRITALAAVTGSVVVTLIATDGNAQVALDTALPAGSNGIGSVTIQGGTSPAPASPTAFTLTTAATTNATLVKSTIGNLYNIAISNTSASPIYVKIFNMNAAPTVGTSVPIIIIPVPANSYISEDFGVVGQRNVNGISYSVTGAQAVTDTTAIAAGCLIAGSYI